MRTKTIHIFLASSNELKADREQFEIEISRKNNLWRDKGFTLHLDIWEDSSARMSPTRSQDEYNKRIKNGDVFVLLAHTKVGICTDEEFETAFGAFQKTKKPFIFTYFKNLEITPDKSLSQFKDKLDDLEHFYSSYNDFNDLWKQFNKELDRLLLVDFTENDISRSEFYVVKKAEKVEIKNKSKTYNTTNTTEYHYYGDKKISKHLGSIPVCPDVFIGRDSNTKEIHEYFQVDGEKNLLLLVNGEGGIGKTTMASKYYHEFSPYYKHLIWLVSEKGIKEAIASLAFNFQLKFLPNFTLLQQVDEIIRYISDLKSPILLVIDNANHLKDLDESEHVLRKFQNVDILITSRVDNYKKIESYKVSHLDKEAANILFKRYYEAFQEEEQTLLDELLEAIGYNTLVIELLAKNLHEFNTGLEAHYPLEKLLNDIQDKGLLKIQKSTEVHTFYKIEAATPEDIINSMYNIAPLSDDEKQILSIFGVLPATVLSYEDLKRFLPTIEMLDRVLIKLSQKGWIDFDENAQNFKTNPIISEIVRLQNKDRLEIDMASLIIFLIFKLEYQPGAGHIYGNFNVIKKMVGYSETLVNHFEEFDNTTSILFERLGNFYKNYDNLQKALLFLEKYKNLKEVYCKSEPNNVYIKNDLSIAYEKLGEIYSSLGNLKLALSFFEEKLKLLEGICNSHPENKKFKHNLSIAYSKLGDISIKMGNLNKALLFFQKDINLIKKLHEGNESDVNFKIGLAVSYSRLGEIYFEIKRTDDALYYFKEDLKLTEELYKKYPKNVGFKQSLAISYGKMGKIHSILGNLEQALSFFNHRVKLSEELYEKYFKNVGFKEDLAISYEGMGIIHNLLGNSEQALFFFQKEIKLFGELYKEHPENVGFKNGLAVTYSQLGKLHLDKLNDKDAGIPYLQKAYKIWKELTEKHPSYVEFQNNYTWIKDILESIEE